MKHRDHGKHRKPEIRSRIGEQPDPEVSANSIFGVSPVIEALRSEKRRIERVLIAEGSRESRIAEVIEACKSLRIPFSMVPARELAAAVPHGSRHQGVVAFVSAAGYSDAGDILENSQLPQLLLLLDGIEDPRNLGAIIRTAECSGVAGVFIPERRAVGLTGTVAKSSAGALEHLPVAKVGNLNRFIEELKSRNIWVVGAAGEAEMNYTEWDWTQPTALVLGAEGSGLHRLVAENCDALVKIPMYGKIDSLNVSVAAGVILFEARRQRSF
ncbi:MAG: 23S rRNA (guanosine(2251)-2'-O)-methyltransferase RlmB [Acidobacteriota bacterium]|nr:MAG: 23S rRNA (guanosine(2251)-2'-O)-methyltransferase RlmB [Acidobacteriota bacterium]